jgi:hypothetical protein
MIDSIVPAGLLLVMALSLAGIVCLVVRQASRR